MTDYASDWRERIVFVTGCTGFLGSWLCRRLSAEGATVIGLSRRAGGGEGRHGRVDPTPTVDVVQGGLEDRDVICDTLTTRDVDTVFHLAAQSLTPRAGGDPPATFEANVGGTWSLLEALRLTRRPVRLVVASSDAVYGDSPTELYSEASPTVATKPYAISKICAEAIVRGYREHFHLRIGVARMSNLYGGGDVSFDRIVPGTIRSALRDEAPLIRSDGTPERDLLYVEDAVDGCLRIATSLDRDDVPAWTFNLSGERPVAVSDVVAAVLIRMGRTDLRPRVLGEPGEALSRIHTSCTRARSLLDWQATTSLESGLDKTIPWYREHAEDVCL